MDITDLRAKVEQLVVGHLGQPGSTGDRDAVVARLVAVRDAIDDLGRILDDLDDETAKRAANLGVVLKRCAKCGRWMAGAPTGRPRLYCTEECKTAARVNRS